MPLGALAAPERIVKPVLAMGGFQHGHTYAGNPLACAAGVAIIGEMDRLNLTENAAAMGEVLLEGLRGLAKRFPFIGDVRGKGLMTAIELVADPATMQPLPEEYRCPPEDTRRAYARGLIVYSRRVRVACRATTSWSRRR